MFIAEKNGKKIILSLAHIDEKKWSGGKSRSTQTLEIFENAGYELTNFSEPERPSKINLLTAALKGISKFGLYKPLCGSSVRTTGVNYDKAAKLVQQYPEVNTYLIEGTGFGDVQLVAMLQSYGKKVILLPINVESLAPYPGAWTHSLSAIERLQVEAKYYAMADAVFCISLEETWLLNILGANAHFLSAFPPKRILDKIVERRLQRQSAIKKGSFYFANFENSPNLLGFTQFVRDGLYKGKTIKVAGIGFEKILPLVKDKPEFIILGELSEERLEEELIHCEKVILNHFPTSGMLTRIPELLLAGIPVEGNIAALKGYTLLSDDTVTPDIMIQRLVKLATDGAEKLLQTIA